MHPPIDIAIPLFWLMEYYISFPSTRTKLTPTWNTGRYQRSAIDMYSAWTADFCSPCITYKDRDNRVLSALSLSPSDKTLSSITTLGMAARLGTESIPYQNLSKLHIQYN